MIIRGGDNCIDGREETRLLLFKYFWMFEPIQIVILKHIKIKV